MMYMVVNREPSRFNPVPALLKVKLDLMEAQLNCSCPEAQARIQASIDGLTAEIHKLQARAARQAA